MGEHGTTDREAQDLGPRDDDGPREPRIAPGKRARTDGLAATGREVQLRPRASGTTVGGDDHGAHEGVEDPFALHLGDRSAPVQRLAAVSAEADPAQVHAAADRGTAGSGHALPHLDAVQQSFGRHDVAGIHAHTGGAAATAADDMGAIAFATGDHVAFAGTPDLHTAAHEAAHVIQQRAGVHLKGGVGAEGDDHERHADAVADRVVAGQSAEALLDRYAGAGAGPAPVQRVVKAKKVGGEDVQDCATFAKLVEVFAIDEEGKKAYAVRLKSLLWGAGVIPAKYKEQFAANNLAVKDEVAKMALQVNDLIGACASPTVISVAANDGAALADALFGVIGNAMDAEYLKKYPHFKMLALGLVGDDATNYLKFVELKRAKLAEYRKAIKYVKHDKAEADKNAQMENRITVLTEEATELETALRTGLTEGKDAGPLVAKMTSFREDIAVIEKAMDLDAKAEEVDDKVKDLKEDESEHNSYANGGVEDGASVGDKYVDLLACSLHALLAVVPGWLGAGSPQELHAILRRTKKLKAYDEDEIVAQIRFMAGLTPTMQQGKRLDAIINGMGEDHPPFIADPIGAAHTFGVVWASSAYRPRDNESDKNTDIMNTPLWKQKQIGTTWQK